MSKTSWRASVRETARRASATLSLSFVKLEIVFQLSLCIVLKELLMFHKQKTQTQEIIENGNNKHPWKKYVKFWRRRLKEKIFLPSF